MINYIHQFIIGNKRRPTEEEVGALMKAVAGQEPGKAKSDSFMSKMAKSKAHGALGGQKKIPVELSPNAMKINDLLRKNITQRDIAIILDLSPRTVQSIIRKKTLPRTRDMILNYKPTKWT
jgi:DNA-binding NarL/FixJ family response regulator